MNALQNLGPEGKGAGSPGAPVIELNHVLAPVDFSPASQGGLAFAAGIAASFGSRLHLLYVLQLPTLPQWGYAHLAMKEAKLRNTAEEKLTLFPIECGINPALVESAEVRSGAAASEICGAALEKKTDLIVIASHGLGGFKHAFIGSTSQAIVRRAPCPVLTVREHTLALENGQRPSFAPKRILVTTDFSDASKKAFPYAAALAHKFQTGLMLLHVVPGHLPAELDHLGIMLEQRQMVSQAREHLPRFREAELDPHLHVESLVVHGSPAHEICTTAEMQNVDLLVIATHGHSGVKRFALGSVAENVIRHAPCPVLVVREREHDFIKDASPPLS